MKAWAAPAIPTLPGQPPTLTLFDSSSQACYEPAAGPTVRMYVCGITPYDATHLGHAATYVTFDVVIRALLDAGHRVEYVQNITDVDDPLLERAKRDGVEWRELAAEQIQLFRDDMSALRVLPPDHYVGVVERMPQIEHAVADLVASGAAYRLDCPEESSSGADIYLDLSRQPSFGNVSGWTRDQMAHVFADRGGDPDRPGKRDPFDPLLWRAARTGEPSWPSSVLGDGRPGWHIECTSIARDLLDVPFDLQGGGTDLVFPHHEMSAVQAGALTGHTTFARGYVHQAMVGLDGEKMSKSKGNLILVSRLRAVGVDPMAVRLVLLEHHYRSPWDYTQASLDEASARLDRWRRAAAPDSLVVPDDGEAEHRSVTHAWSDPYIAELARRVRERLADDLDTPGALAAVDDWASCNQATPDLSALVDALLGVRLEPQP